MLSRFLKVLKAVLKTTTILAALGLLYFGWLCFEPIVAKHSLAQAAARADHIVIDIDTWPREESSPPSPSVVIRDPKAITSFVDAVDFVPGIMWDRCACYGTMRLHFRKGEQTLFTLISHHGKSITGVKPDLGDLTRISKRAVEQWFEVWGGKALVDAKAEYQEMHGYKPLATQPISMFASDDLLWE